VHVGRKCEYLVPTRKGVQNCTGCFAAGEGGVQVFAFASARPSFVLCIGVCRPENLCRHDRRGQSDDD